MGRKKKTDSGTGKGEVSPQSLANLRPWKPGQSGNPAGYSRQRRITDALIKLIDEQGVTQALAKIWLREALQANPRFFTMLLDRVEGQVDEAAETAVTIVEQDLTIDDRRPRKASRKSKSSEAASKAVQRPGMRKTVGKDSTRKKTGH